ncbi:MAG: hypothetical protein LBS03_00370 [Bacteroidales bacterium]|jgi:hypothetical protein|nr:hypothetical protein [Bacteroidales bacterium]
MFYARINKIKVFNNREGFLGLFNRAELRIYGYASPSGGASLTPDELLALPDDAARRQRLLDAVATEAEHFAQSSHLQIDGVRDNQTLTFGETGILLYRSDAVPDALHLQLWVIESDEDVRRLATDIDGIINSDAFKGLATAFITALAVSNPIVTASIGLGTVFANLLRQKLRANRDDLVGYWQAALHRAEHYPHGTRDRQDVADTTGNLLVDYTLFGIINN